MRPTQRRPAEHALAALVIAVAWIGMVALVDPIGDFPIDDDWMYGKAAQTLAQTGDFRILGPVTPNVLSQAVWGALFCIPFGCSFTALRISTAVAGLLGILAFYALLREIGADNRIGLLATATLAVNPLYFGLANSFMTDVPFLSLSIVSIYFVVRGFLRESQLCLILGIVIALVALLDRQFAVALLLGFAVAYPIRFGWKPMTVLSGAIPLGLGLLLQFTYQSWLTSTGRAPGAQYTTIVGLLPASPLSFVALSIKYAGRSTPYLGLFVLPVTVAVPARPVGGGNAHRQGLIRAICGSLALSLFSILWWWGRALPLMGDILTETGLGPLSLRDGLATARAPVLSQTGAEVWLVATALGCFSVYRILCIAVFAAQRSVGHGGAGNQTPWLHAFFATVLASYWPLTCLLVNSSGLPVDRYLLFMVPILLAWIVLATTAAGVSTRLAADYPRGRTAVAITGALIVGFGAFSVAATHDLLSWNRARRAATDYLVAGEHVEPRRIDGGYEFNGYHLYDPAYKRKNTKSWWWVIDDEYVIASGDMPGYGLIRNYHYSRWLPPYGKSVVVLRRTQNAASPESP